MADNNSFPKLSASNWWNIRKKFKQSIPGTVTSNYLSSVLNMQEQSASANIMPYLKQVGIIDQDGKTGERAKSWRDDVDYPLVCDVIKKEIYPQELLDIPVSTNEDKESVKRWFSRATGTGEKSVGMIAAFYFLLCEKDPSKESNGSKVQPKSEKSKAIKTNGKAVAQKAEINPMVQDDSATDKATIPSSLPTPAVPAININLQIHISSDASPEQIDKIFESMNKHIYSRKDDLNG